MPIVSLQGERKFNLSVERMFSELSDLNNFIKIVPDVKEIKSISKDQAHIIVTPGLSFVRGELDTTIDVTTGVNEATITVASKGIGSFSKMQVSFQLEGTDTTLLKWNMDVVELGGLLKLVPTSLMKGAAGKITNDLLNNLEKMTNENAKQ